MQPATGATHPSMAAAPAMDPQQQQHQQQQQQWAMMMPAYQNQVPPPTWSQQPPPPQGATPYMMQHQQPPQHQAYASGASQPQSAEEVRTLWIGDLQLWMEESYIHSCFVHTGEVLNVKVIRNKATGQSESYGFIEFNSHAAAERILQTYNGQLMPNVEQNFRLNWASFGSGDKRQDDSADFTVFVGDLAADVTDYVLQETFKAHYTSVKGAKVVTDRTTGRSKGYGFVRFADEGEQARAMTEMNGQFCSTRPMRIGPASNKKTSGVGQQHPKATYQSTLGTQNESDPNNTTIFVGGLDSNVTEENLRQIFSQYGELSHVKIPVGKRCGFVQFDNRACAEEALLMLNGSVLGGSSIRLSWGRSPSNKQDQSGGMVQQHADPNQWPAAAGNMYGYNGGYEAYGYVSAAQDPNMYSYQGYGGPGYGNYQQHQHQ